jgi:hypothetical protein
MYAISYLSHPARGGFFYRFFYRILPACRAPHRHETRASSGFHPIADTKFILRFFIAVPNTVC